MPISPENMKLYPGGSIRSPEWLAIRRNIKARAKNCCEQCGVENGAIGGRDEDGRWFDAQEADARPGDIAYCSGADGERELRIIKIVCTVAHLDCKLDDHSDTNLRFWCQRCHNRHDNKSRQVNAKATRRSKSGQFDLEGLL